MSNMNPLNPYGGNTPKIEQMIGAAYDNVRKVAQNIDTIKAVSLNKENIDKAALINDSVLTLEEEMIQAVEVTTTKAQEATDSSVIASAKANETVLNAQKAKVARDEAVQASTAANSLVGSVSKAVLSYPNYTSAFAAAATLPDGQSVEILQDETRYGARARYRMGSGGLVFVVNLDQLRLDLLSPYGSSHVMHEDTSLYSVANRILPMSSPSDLRSYTGYATSVLFTEGGVSGVVRYDPLDTTSADNDVTVYVDATGRRFKRDTSLGIFVDWAKGDDNEKVRKTIAAIRAQGFGSIEFSGREYTLVEENFDVSCSNVTFNLRSDTRILCTGRVLFDWPPTGLGYNGGYRDILIRGGQWYGVGGGHVQFNMAHVQFVEVVDGTYIDCVNWNHVFDLMGCRYFVARRNVVIGKVGADSTHYVEFIQIGDATAAGTGWPRPEFDEFRDNLNCSYIWVEDNQFLPRINASGAVVSYAPRPCGNHSVPVAGAVPPHHIYVRRNFVDRVQPPSGTKTYLNYPVFSVLGVDTIVIEDNEVLSHRDTAKDRTLCAIVSHPASVHLAEKVDVSVINNQMLLAGGTGAQPMILISVVGNNTTVSLKAEINVSGNELSLNNNSQDSGVYTAVSGPVPDGAANMTLKGNTYRAPGGTGKRAFSVGSGVNLRAMQNEVHNVTETFPFGVAGPGSGGAWVIDGNVFYNCACAATPGAVNSVVVSNNKMFGGMGGATSEPVQKGFSLPTRSSLFGNTFVSPVATPTVLINGVATASTGINYVVIP